MQSASRLPHLVRGSSAAAIATFTALCAHVVGGGAAPGLIGIVVPLALSVMVCTLLAGRTLSRVRLSISVIASQLLFHTLFVLGAGGGSATSGAAHPHHSHASLSLAASTANASAAEHTMSLLHGDALMWLAHLGGAVATIVFLYQGEQTIHRLRRLAAVISQWLRLSFRGPVRLPVAVRPVRLAVRAQVVWDTLSQLGRRALTRRGPPASAWALRSLAR